MNAVSLVGVDLLLLVLHGDVAQAARCFSEDRRELLRAERAILPRVPGNAEHCLALQSPRSQTTLLEMQMYTPCFFCALPFGCVT